MGYDANKAAEALPTVLKLAGAGAMDLASASDMVTDSMAALGIEATKDNLTRFSDQLAKTASKSNTSVSQLGEAILTVGGTAKVLAGGTTEMNTALGILADNGIKGAEGGTALRNMILSLTAPTDTAKAALSGLGISALDSSGNVRPLNETFKDLDNKLSSMSDGEKTEVLNKIFNKTDLKSVNALLANSGERFDYLTEAIENSAGACEDMYAIQLDNLQGDLSVLSSGLSDLGISIYKDMNAPLRDATKTATDMVSKLSEALSSGGFDGFTNEFGSVFAEIVQEIAEYTPYIIDASVNIVKSFIQGISDNADSISSSAIDIVTSLAEGMIDVLPKIIEVGGEMAIKLIEGLANKLPELVPEIVGAITDLATAVINNADVFVDAGAQLISGLVEGLENSIPGLSSVLDPIKDLFSFVSDNANEVTSALVGIGTGLAVFEAGTMIMSFVSSMKDGTLAVKAMAKAQGILNAVMAINPFVLIAAAIAGLVAGIIYLWNTNEGFRDAVIGIWQSVCDACSSIFGSITSFFTETIPEAFDSCCDAVASFCDSVASFFTETIPNVISNVGVWFSELPGKIAYGLGVAVGAIANWIVECYTYLTTNIPLWIDSIGTWFSNLPGVIWTWLTQTITSFMQWGADMLNTASTVTSSTITAIITWFSQLPGNIWNWLVQVVSNMSSWGSNMLSTATQSVSTVCSGIVDGFTNLPSKMVEIGTNIVDGIKNGIKNAWDNMTGWIGGLCENFVVGVKSEFDIHSPSRVMKNQVGKWIPLGISEGLKSTTGDLLSTAADMCSSLSDSIKINAPEVGVNWNAEGGIFDNPTIFGTNKGLQGVGEAGAEAILPLSVLWDKMTKIISSLIFDDAKSIDFDSLISKLDGKDNYNTNNESYESGPVIQYSPVYKFYGSAPSKEDMVQASRMSQDEFGKMMKKWQKDNGRFKFA